MRARRTGRVAGRAGSPKVVAKAVEVIVSKCEERLRVGSDFLFDFDRAELRLEAAPEAACGADRPPVPPTNHFCGCLK
jgi:hypothetical protein